MSFDSKALTYFFDKAGQTYDPNATRGSVDFATPVSLGEINQEVAVFTNPLDYTMDVETGQGQVAYGVSNLTYYRAITAVSNPLDYEDGAEWGDFATLTLTNVNGEDIATVQVDRTADAWTVSSVELTAIVVDSTDPVELAVTALLSDI